ncbi:hypothetical protein M231_05279 [Tremella mesenterica]|uniref:Uncharacterized protein n=1 Tax=Tremella mesenterica TaxID=5217 RepID=A0A4Q1BIL4_TREME|nr:hypothetical protein M231_05279 [Tremella mesenterica]
MQARGMDLGGAPGYIDVTSPTSSSPTGAKIASLVLSTSNGTSSSNDTSTAEGFVLNASNSIRTQVYLVPLSDSNSNSTSNSTDPTTSSLQSTDNNGPIQVNLKVPIFVAETAEVESYCATFDPLPKSAKPLTVQPCVTEGDSHTSQVFLYDPSTGVIHPDWTPNTTSQQVLQSVPDSVEETTTSSIPTSTMIMSSAMAESLPTDSSHQLLVSPSDVTSISEASITPSVVIAGIPTSKPTPSNMIKVANVLPSSSSSMLSPSVTPLNIKQLDSMPTLLPSSSMSTISSIPTDIVQDVDSTLSTSMTISTTESVLPATTAVPSSAAEMVAGDEDTSDILTPSSSSPPALQTGGKQVSTESTSTPMNKGSNVTLVFSPSNPSLRQSDFEENEGHTAGTNEGAESISSPDTDDNMIPSSVSSSMSASMTAVSSAMEEAIPSTTMSESMSTSSSMPSIGNVLEVPMSLSMSMTTSSMPMETSVVAAAENMDMGNDYTAPYRRGYFRLR